MAKTNVGQRVRELRKNTTYLTQQELADAAGCTREHLGRIECGKSDPSLGMLSGIADALGVTLADMVTDLRVSA